MVAHSLTLKAFRERISNTFLRCHECGEFDGGYFVRCHVWRRYLALLREAGVATRRPLLCCIVCLDKRVGLLTIDDFDLELPINHGIRFGLELARRDW
jgi:hypothetical protein